jgi:hypothetical protein
VFVPEQAHVLLAQQGAVGDNFAHGWRFSSGICIISPCGIKRKRIIF